MTSGASEFISPRRGSSRWQQGVGEDAAVTALERRQTGKRLTPIHPGIDMVERRTQHLPNASAPTSCKMCERVIGER